MSDNLKRKDFANLPETAGLFCLFDTENNALFAGAAENLKNEIVRISESEISFAGESDSVEIHQTNENLPREFARLIRLQNPRFNFSVNEQALYPHLKITREKFPRLLVTRRILNEEDEYFGAFLPATGVRIWLYVLNKIFRLRSCELDIRGDDLPAPCAMFREKRCLAPCRIELCDVEKYAESVDLLRLFLSREEKELENRLKTKIEKLAENLEFEAASRQRDLLNSVQNIFANKRMNLWLEGNAVDTFYLEENDSEKLVHLVTTRGRRTLGFQTFVFPLDEIHSDSFVLNQILWQFYQFHAPREIRLTRDFEGRRFFAQSLSRQAKRDVKISVISEKVYKTAFLALKRSKLDLEMKRLSGLQTIEEIQAELKAIFSLTNAPRRIEAFDVAHISNENFVAASAVWENGKLNAKEARFWLLDSANEPQAMAEAVNLRLSENDLKPDLIVLDGGRGQLKAVLSVLNDDRPKIIGAVKPSGRHAEISYFLTEDGEKVDFEPTPAFEVLRSLRDEAHARANEIHRQRRENRALFEREPEKTMLVPVRFDEPGGAAENLRLISKVKF